MDEYTSIIVSLLNNIPTKLPGFILQSIRNCHELAAVLMLNNSLQELEIESDIDLGDTLGSDLSMMLKVNTSLQVLSLTRNNLRATGVLPLTEALIINTSLKNLNLLGNDLKDEGAIHLAQGLMGNTSLQVLNLADNNIGARGACSIAEMLKHNTGLRNLSLASNEIGETGAFPLAQALKSNTTLQSLDLGDNALYLREVIHVVEALKQNSTLKELDLGWNFLDETAIYCVAEVLKVNTSLQVLNLAGNNIGHKGAEYLAKALKVNTSLQVLNLASCDLNSQGAVFLAEALKVNTGLQVLNLEDNNLRVGGMNYLAQALKENINLRELNLNDNNIEYPGGVLLAEALKINSTIQSITLLNNNLAAAVYNFIDALVINYHLIHLGLSTHDLTIENYVRRNLAIHNAVKNIILDTDINVRNMDSINALVLVFQEIISQYNIHLIDDNNIIAESLRLLFAKACMLEGSENPHADALVALEKEFVYVPFKKIADELIVAALMNLSDSFVENAQDLLMRSIWLFAKTQNNQDTGEYRFAIIILKKLQELKKVTSDLTQFAATDYLPMTEQMSELTPTIDLDDEILLDTNRAKSYLVERMVQRGARCYSIAFFTEESVEVVDEEQKESIELVS